MPTHKPPEDLDVRATEPIDSKNAKLNDTKGTELGVLSATAQLWALITFIGLHENQLLHLHAAEPENLAVLLAFHQDRAIRLPEQTQRRAYSSCARRRCNVVVAWRIFCWVSSPLYKIY